MSERQNFDFCPTCGASIPYGQDRCPQCGRSAVNMDQTGSWGGRPDPRVRPPERSSRPVVAGVLMLVMGIPALLVGLLLLGEIDYLTDMVIQELEALGEDASSARTAVEIIVYSSLAVGFISSLGGLLAIMRRYLPLALVCALVLTILGMSLLVPGIFGVAALVLIYQSREEFS